MGHFLILSSYFISSSQSQTGSTLIDGIWIDDFQIDPTQSNGWHIYYGNDQTQTLMNNPIVQGETLKYHGPFTRNGNVHQHERNNWLRRMFQCQYDASAIYASFYFAFCDTDSSDTTRIEYDHKAAISSIPMTTSDATQVTDPVFLTNIDSYVNSSRCQDDDNWHYKYHHHLQLATDVTKNTPFLVGFRQRINTHVASAWAVLYNITIECDFVSISPPTPSPTPCEHEYNEAAGTYLECTQEANDIVALHNAARKRIREGTMVSSYGAQPKGPAVADLQYDNGLAQNATEYAQRCFFLIHSDVAGRDYQGENIYTFSYGPQSNTPIHMTDDIMLNGVESWISEGDYYDYSPVGAAKCDFQTCGHYTQIINEEVTKVGCAWANCHNEIRGYWTHLICRYDVLQQATYPYEAADTQKAHVNPSHDAVGVGEYYPHSVRHNEWMVRISLTDNAGLFILLLGAICCILVMIYGYLSYEFWKSEGDMFSKTRIMSEL